MYSDEEYPKKMVINVAVAGLCTAPQSVSVNITLPTSEKTNPLQASQLLFGEYVVAQKEVIDFNNAKWLKIDALQQERYRKSLGWHSFPGYILKNQAIVVHHFPKYNLVVKNLLTNLYDNHNQLIKVLSVGTRLHGERQSTMNRWKVLLSDKNIAYVDDKDVYQMSEMIDETIDELRKNIVSTAKLFLGNFYSWGGRSAESASFGIVSSVDCSSFMNLVFLAHGLQIPRNAKDQYIIDKKIEHGKDLQPGDLVFFSRSQKLIQGKKSLDICHVMLYAGDDKLIEVSRSGDCTVRIISFEERIGISRDEIKSGDLSSNVTTSGVVAGQYYVYFASYFVNPVILQFLRKKALVFNI